MIRISRNTQNVLRTSAVLLITLPAIVAVACFAHGHGALMSEALLAVLSMVFSLGALAAYGLFNVLDNSRKSDCIAKSRTATGVNPAPANLS